MFDGFLNDDETSYFPEEEYDNYDILLERQEAELKKREQSEEKEISEKMILINSGDVSIPDDLDTLEKEYKAICLFEDKVKRYKQRVSMKINFLQRYKRASEKQDNAACCKIRKDITRAKVIKLYGEMHSIQKVANYLNCGYNTVKRILD